MGHRDLTDLSRYTSMGGRPVPGVVLALAGGEQVELVWRNEVGGLTFHLGDRYVKWNPRRNGIDLRRERRRLEWLDGRHPAPRVLDHGGDDEAQWLVTGALPGDHAVGETWRARRAEAIGAIAEGLRRLHGMPVDDVPAAWSGQSWLERRPVALGPAPTVDDPVLVHGDACAPNTLVSPTGRFVGHVDVGDLAVGDRWADLAIASMSIDWNFDPGHQEELYDAYGVEPDEERIRWYRALWELEA